MKSISMSAGNAQAILEGRKTETRRLSKLKKVNAKPNDWELIDCVLMDIGGIYGYWGYWSNSRDVREYKQVARWHEHDILYIREPWKLIDNFPYNKEINGDIAVRVQYQTDPQLHTIWFNPERYAALDVLRKADIKPAMFMPEEVSRIHVQVEDVSIEQVQDITRTGIIAEGIEVSKSNQSICRFPNWSIHTKKAFRVPHEAWQWLWNSINKNCRYEHNPWVWVIKFSTCGKDK